MARRHRECGADQLWLCLARDTGGFGSVEAGSHGKTKNPMPASRGAQTGNGNRAGLGL